MFVDVLNSVGTRMLEYAGGADFKNSPEGIVRAARGVKKLAVIAMVASVILTTIALMYTSSVAGILGIAILGFSVFALCSDAYLVGDKLDYTMNNSSERSKIPKNQELFIKQLYSETNLIRYFV